MIRNRVWHGRTGTRTRTEAGLDFGNVPPPLLRRETRKVGKKLSCLALFLRYKDVRVGVRILLADNSMGAQNRGKKILTAAGYDVVTVSNGLAACRKITELHPDLALLDVYMPGYTGIEICEKTKATPETAKIPVLLTVSKMEPFRAEEGIKVKADGVVIKPFEANDLIEIVGRFARNGHSPELAARRDDVVQESEPPKHQPSKNTANEYSVSAEAVGTAQGRAQQTPAGLSAGKGTPCNQSTPEATKRGRWSDLSEGDTHQPPLSRQRGGEICDVCGYVNGEGATVCQQCDVPLPSSVFSFRATSSQPS